MEVLTKEPLNHETWDKYAVKDWGQLQDWIYVLFRGTSPDGRQLGIFVDKTSRQSFKFTAVGELNSERGYSTSNEVDQNSQKIKRGRHAYRHSYPFDLHL
jgi:hypothetical protein